MLKYNIKNKSLVASQVEILIMGLGSFYFGILALVASFKCIITIDREMSILFNAGLLLAVILILVFSLIMFFVSYCSIKLFFYLKQLYSMGIAFSEESILFNTRYGDYSVPFSKIMHILKDEREIALVWNTQSGSMTFIIKKSLFGNNSIKEISKVLEGKDKYTNDIDQIKKINKSLKFDNIFRKNHFEYQIEKLVKNA